MPPYESMIGGVAAGSASRRSISVATLKTLSARRKNASRIAPVRATPTRNRLRVRSS